MKEKKGSKNDNNSNNPPAQKTPMQILVLEAKLSVFSKYYKALCINTGRTVSCYFVVPSLSRIGMVLPVLATTLPSPIFGCTFVNSKILEVSLLYLAEILSVDEKSR